MRSFLNRFSAQELVAFAACAGVCAYFAASGTSSAESRRFWVTFIVVFVISLLGILVGLHRLGNQAHIRSLADLSGSWPSVEIARNQVMSQIQLLTTIPTAPGSVLDQRLGPVSAEFFSTFTEATGTTGDTVALRLFGESAYLKGALRVGLSCDGSEIVVRPGLDEVWQLSAPPTAEDLSSSRFPSLWHYAIYMMIEDH